MEASPSVAGQERYVLATGEPAAARLRLLQEICGPATAALLGRVGLRAGMRAADIGCGIGTVSVQLAKAVGPEGALVGVDASPEQIEVARREAAAAQQSNATFTAASAYDTGLPRESFDLVYCRFLLCHLQRPLDALQEMQALLKAGGVLVCDFGNNRVQELFPDERPPRLVAS